MPLDPEKLSRSRDAGSAAAAALDSKRTVKFGGSQPDGIEDRHTAMPQAKRVLIVWIVASTLASSLLLAETDEARMKRSYTVTRDSAFILEPGVTAKAAFDKHGGACAFTLFGDMSEEKVQQTFDVLVPTKKRGSNKPQESMTCAGACIKSVVYKNVGVVTGSFGKARSDPAARITFKRSGCKAAVAEAQKQVWHLNRPQ